MFLEALMVDAGIPGWAAGKAPKATLTALGLLIAVVTMTLLSFAESKPNWGTTGTLEGRVVDKANGEPLAGVNILVVGTTYGSVSDTEGYYRISNLRAGVYDVRFSIIGYKNVVMQKVTILPDLRTRLDIEFEQTTIELETIEVRAEKPLIQRDLAASTFSVGEIKLEKLPVSSFRDVVILQPSTTLEGNIRGGKTNEVIFLVDGLPVQDVVAGGLGTSLPKSSITGMTINTGGFDAEYGNALSGVVNVITKSGGDRHLFFVRYERDSWIPERWNKQQDRATEFEFTAGGPIVPGKLFYFTANNVLATDTRWWQDFDRFYDSPVSQEFTGFGKVEFVLSPTLRLTGQGIYSIRDWKDYEFSWRFNLPGLPTRGRSSYRFAGTLSHTLSENTYYSVTGSLYYLNTRIGEGPKESLSLQPYEYDFFLRYIVSGQRNWWAKSRQMIFGIKGDVTHEIENKHILKLGVEFNEYDILSDLVKYEPQTTYFGKPLVDAPLLNYSNRYNYQPRAGSVFLQDKIELVRDGSNFSVGVRWDFLDPTAERPLVEYIPVGQSQSEYQQIVTGTAKARFKQQISPRVSGAFPVGLSSFFYLNFGHYFQFPLFDYLYSGISPSQIRGGARGVLTGNPDLDPERTVAWEIGFKHGLSGGVVGSATLFSKTFKNQIDSKTLIPFDSKNAGDYGFSQFVNNAEATAKGFELVVTRERDEKLTGTVSYSYVVTEGLSESVDQGINFAQWGFEIPSVVFPLSWDQRHAIKADGEFRLFGDVQTNVVVLYNSPRPYTYYPTRDGFTALDTTKVLIPNNRRMKDVLIVNAKLTKQLSWGDATQYRLIIFADIRNLLNKRNVRWIDSSGRVGGELGDPGALYDLRRIRVGMRLEF